MTRSGVVWRAGLVLGGLLVLLPMAGGWRWSRATAALVEQLQRPASRDTRPGTSGLAGLPPPVRRYFERVLPPSAGRIRQVVAVQDGDFRMAEEDDSWRPFRATEHFTTDPPGFVWDARIELMPFVNVRVRDGFVGGAGQMRASVAGVIPVVDEVGKPELDVGALQRYLAEAVWFPTALLPGPALRWEPLDGSRARAVLQAAGRSVSAEFRFDAGGDVVEVVIPDRFREVHGQYEPTPWAVTCGAHAVRGGFRIPTSCVVEWRPDSGSMPYWRGRIIDIRFTAE